MAWLWRAAREHNIRRDDQTCPPLFQRPRALGERCWQHAMSTHSRADAYAGKHGKASTGQVIRLGSSPGIFSACKPGVFRVVTDCATVLPVSSPSRSCQRGLPPCFTPRPPACRQPESSCCSCVLRCWQTRRKRGVSLGHAALRTAAARHLCGLLQFWLYLGIVTSTVFGGAQPRGHAVERAERSAPHGGHREREARTPSKTCQFCAYFSFECVPGFLLLGASSRTMHTPVQFVPQFLSLSF